MAENSTTTGSRKNPAETADPKATRPACRELPAAARRALQEAEDRRTMQATRPLPREINGRDGPEPTRFGDWEKDGLTSDF